MKAQMAPMMQMMRAKMGKKRFGAMVQTMGPMMSQMTQGGVGGLGGGLGGDIPGVAGGIPGGVGGIPGSVPGGGIPGGGIQGGIPSGPSASAISGETAAAVAGFGGVGGAPGGDMMTMVAPLMQTATADGVPRRHRHK